MEKTLVILKPSAIQRALVGEVIKRFEQKGLRLLGIKMIQLSEEIVNEHYAHLANRPFFQRIKESMMITPVIVTCWYGKDAISVVRNMAGTTNSREATLGTIRGDFSMSKQENIVHTSDTAENAKEELARFFKDDEIFEYPNALAPFFYANDEI